MLDVTDFWEGAEVISVYTRAQAIEDGTLVDVTRQAGPEMLNGFTCPVALTAAVWADVQAVPRSGLEDARGRLHDLLWMARVAAARHPEESTVLFHVLLRVGRTRRQTYKLHAGPGDAGEMVIAIMQPHED